MAYLTRGGFASGRIVLMGKENPWKRPTAERFWEKVDRGHPADCWLWLASKTAGYGYFSYNGRPKFAHRVAWELENGPIPDGLNVCHKCDVRDCVNPAHLFLGTHQENMRDAWEKGRMSHSLRPEGSRKSKGGPPRTKLTPEQVQEIRDRRAVGELLRILAAEYEIHTSQVSRIASGERWQSLPPRSDQK